VSGELRIRLREILTARFSVDELRTLCFELEIPYENLPGTLDGLAREVIVYSERRGRLAELIETARRLRPDVEWGDLRSAPTPAARRLAAERPHAPATGGAMTDAAAIAARAIALLSPYLAQIGGAAAPGTEAAWEKARQIHETISSRLQEEQDGYPAETLRRFEEQPEARRGAMRSVLQEFLDADPAFGRVLDTLLEEADRAGTGAVFAVNVFGGQVGEIINIERLDGGLTIHKRQANDER
jgi:hypothetical protein